MTWDKNFRKKLSVGAAGVVVLACVGWLGYAALFHAPYRELADRSVSGNLLGNIELSGTVTVTGDTTIEGNLRLQPGTTVKFVVGDDQGTGDEVSADGYNDRDPTRLSSYTRTHASLSVLGRIEARGSVNSPIVFTSAAATPHRADWEAVYFYGDGSVFDHIVVEYSRNGMNPLGSQPHSVASDSVFRHNMWSGPSLSRSSMTLMGSDVSDAGHEGVDVQGGHAVIRGNHIHDIHSGVVVVAGTADIEDNVMDNVGDGIGLASPDIQVTDRNNRIHLAAPHSRLQWCYGAFCYRMFNK